MDYSAVISRLYLRARVLLNAGRFTPEWVNMPPHGHRVRIDPTDMRALRFMALQTMRGRYFRNRDYWERACRLLAPDWAIDVGVNYGECLFLPRYADHTRVLGIEANPGLRRFLEDSLAVHPCSPQIRLLFAAAAAESGSEISFFVDELWSGRSTMAKKESPGQQRARREIKVETVCIDDVLACNDASRNTKIVFKIDVEGYERHVLSGMWRTIDTSSIAMGLIEFDPQMLANADVDAEEFAEELHARFDVWYFSGQKSIVHSNRRNLYEAMRTAPSRKGFHTDLLLCRNIPDDELQQILSPWLNAACYAA